MWRNSLVAGAHEEERWGADVLDLADGWLEEEVMVVDGGIVGEVGEVFVQAAGIDPIGNVWACYHVRHV